ncbi:MAG TPA: CHAT domain-containing protein [Actinophytocola sp.]|uniref:CHAT domain-containing protein n=1 Tax=Actinophytocola sp. TaxID=1872138 RepID=UPI002DBB729C|nr:CHAT domain-containing protein [Actinophytocola sp.]HEU5472710.1 CHAT domain-containing protein [Actinophytocola sp.]
MPEQPTLEQLFLALRERLEYHERTGDTKAVLDPQACAQAEALRDFGVYLPKDGAWPPLVLDWNITRLLATWHYARSELDAAAFLFSLVDRVAPDAVPEPLRARVRALPTPEVADLPGVSAQFRDAFARWEAGDVDALEIMIRLSSWATAGTPDGHPGKPMLLSHLCTGLRCRFVLNGDPADLEGAVAVGRRSVELAPADHPERAIILHNCSFALQDRFGTTRSAEDLDAAIDLARDAVAAMPEDAPYRAVCLSNAGMTLMRRFERRGQRPDITEAVASLRAALRAAPAGNRPLRATLLINTALALHARFTWFGNPVDLDAAVRGATAAVRVCPPNHPDTARFLAHLCQALMTRFEHLTDPADADAAVDAARRAAASDDRPPRAYQLDTLGAALRHRGQHRHDLGDLTEAVRVHEQAVSAVPHGSAEHAGCLASLCTSRLALFEHTGQLADVDAAVDAGRQALHDGADAAERFVILTALAAALRARAERTRSAGDLDDAIALFEQASRAVPDGHPALVTCLSELGSAHTSRFRHTGDIADLDRGITASERSVELAGQHDTRRMIDATNLANAYRLRFFHAGDLADLHAAIDWGREAVLASPDDDPNRASAEFNLGSSMQARFQRTGSLTDLDEAVRLMELAERCVHSDHERHAVLLAGLGAALRLRYERLDRQADGDRAIELCRRAVDVLPAGHPDRAGHLTNLAGALSARCIRTGAPEDSEAAVAAGREALRLTSGKNVDLATTLATLANALRERYEQTFALSDLDEAIQAHRSAVDAIPADHPLCPLLQSNFSGALMSRFLRTRDPAGVNEMVGLARSAVEATPAGHADRPRYLSRYTYALHLRHGTTMDSEDAEAELAAIQEAVRLTSDDHPNRLLYLGNLAAALHDRYLHSQRRLDLDAVIEAARAALRTAPAGHPDNGRIQHHLGWALINRAERTGSLTDLQTAIGQFRDVARAAAAPTELRIRAARQWGAVASWLKRWAEAVAGYRTAIELLPLLAWHGLDRADRVSALGEFTGLASTAAAAALMLDDPGQALQLLEQGRGVLLAQALDARRDLSELAALDPDLAARLRTVRAELDSTGPPAADDEGAERALADRRRELAREWDTLLTRARKLPGLTDLLRLPSLDRLHAAAAGGPVVVINVHPRRCDALIVTATGLSTVRLRGLDPEQVRDHATTLLDALAGTGDSVAGAWRAQRALDKVLAWLWDTVAEPVLDALPSDPARLWWCPTGLLTFLPVHAAGHHSSGSGRTLLDRVVCSYTPTLRALAEVRSGPPAPVRMLAVGQPATPGLSPLPQAMTEVRRLASLVPGTTLLCADAATRQAVLTALPDHTHLHFAGHGGQNPRDGGGGALYCADHQPAGPITVADISGLRLARAELVFLSACETARGVISVPDEAVHLAGALRLAGFPHVVATQWMISDKHAADIAEHFYTGLTGESGRLVSSRAAAALHAAVRRLRDQHAYPLLWASYIHTGP